jgi:hypothetical protein
MNLHVLIQALEHYIQSADCISTDEVFKGLKECYQVLERYRDAEVWNYAVRFVNENMLMTLLQMTTYDIYGQCQRMYSNPSFHDYAYKCRRVADLDGLTNNQLLIAHDYIGDLWHDNEEYGCNNADGTFNKD